MITPLRWQSSGAGRAALSGALTFATAADAYALGVHALETDAADSMIVDCKAVSLADGAGLAVLLAWMAQAQARGRRLRYENLPDALRRIARISEVETFLCP